MTSLIFFMSIAAQYTVANETANGIPLVVLTDKTHQTEVRVVPSIGNNAYSMKVKGQEIFWSPYQTLTELKAKPTLMGTPFLAPWANRIEGAAFWANEHQFWFNPHLGNIRPDGNKNPIHGLLLFTDRWKVVDSHADAGSATVRSRLEFYRDPAWMAQFPFAHAIEMTYRLKDGALEVVTEIENLSSEKMPVAIGFHPYYKLPGERDSWSVHIPAKEHVQLSKTLIPTGERTPVSSPDPFPLKGTQQDDVYTSLVRDGSGNADFWVTNGKQKLTFAFGPKYQVGVVYAPPGRDFICFEPMAAITDAFNQNHAGKYAELQSIAPGGKWRESWWIRPSGF